MKRNKKTKTTNSNRSLYNIFRQYPRYLLRWQLSTPLLAFITSWLTPLGFWVAAGIANFVGGLIFFWVDRRIFVRKDKLMQTNYILWVTLSVRRDRYVEESKLPPFVAGVYSSIDKATEGIDMLNKSLSNYCRERGVQDIYKIETDILCFDGDKEFPQSDWSNFIG